MNTHIRHIILADDDEEDIELFQSGLLEVYLEVQLDVAVDGVTLMNLLKYSPVPDLIVLDINMPCMSGKQCLVGIRSNKMFDHVPVIMLSTSNSQSDIDYCITNGANRYFTKPANFRELKSFIEKLCEGLTV